MQNIISQSSNTPTSPRGDTESQNTLQMVLWRKGRTPGILTLPDELLLFIIKEAMKFGQQKPVLLSHVSQRLRRLVLHCPFLWTALHHSSGKTMTVDLVRTYLERSGNLPIEIDVAEHGGRYLKDHDAQERFQTFMQLVLPHSQRWKSFHVEYYTRHTPDEDDCPILFSNLPLHLRDAFRSPTLETLRIDIYDTNSFTEPNPDAVFWTTILAESKSRLPKLHDVVLFDFTPPFRHLNHSVCNLDSIATLDICLSDYLSDGVELDILAFYLQAHTALEKLTMEFRSVNIGDWNPRREDEGGEILMFTLTVSFLEVAIFSDEHGAENVAQLLNCCHFPNVKHLVLFVGIPDADELQRTINTFCKICNHYPSLEKLTIGYDDDTGGIEDDIPPSVDIELSIDKFPSIKDLTISIGGSLPLIKLIAGNNLGRGPSRFPSLRSLCVHTPDTRLVKDWIVEVVEVLRDQGDWDSFEWLSVSAGTGPNDPRMSREESERWLRAIDSHTPKLELQADGSSETHWEQKRILLRSYLWKNHRNGYYYV